MLSRLLTMVTITFTFASFCLEANCDHISDVYAIVKSEKKLKKGRLPTKVEKPSCQYSPELVFTIDALSEHCFQSLFDETTLARATVTTWVSNTDKHTGLLRKALLDLESTLQTPGVYDRLTFCEMIYRRLDGTLDRELDDSISLLQERGFCFPLFIPVASDELTKIHSLIMRTIQGYQGKDTGGFGNLTWVELFYTPAKPSYIGESQIAYYIAEVQGVILPYPTLVCGEIDNRVDATEVRLHSSSRCCCNYASHGKGKYRTCRDADPQYSCTTCSNDECCIAGVDWCGYHELGEHD